MARHRTTKPRSTLSRSTPRRKTGHRQSRLTKAPPSKFRVRLGHVEVVSGSELFERRVAGIKEGKKRAMRRMGKLGERIKAVEKKPGVESHRIRKGRVSKIKVLVKARIKGRLAYFTKTMKFPRSKTTKQAGALEKEFLSRIKLVVGQSPKFRKGKGDGILGFKVFHEKAA